MGDYQNCPNCKRNILVQSWLIHKTVCERHNYYCDICEQVINTHEVKKHEVECPEKYIPCDHCEELIKNKDRTQHLQEDCEKRLVNCKYCDLSQKACTLEAHESSCGSRTKKCENCDKRIQLKNFSKHKCTAVNVKKTVRFKGIDSKKSYSELKKSQEICPFCDQTFDDNILVQEHIFTEHAESL